MRPKLILFLMAVLLLLSTTAMGSVVGKIKGTITDSKTLEPLVGASVAIKGTTLGGTTNHNGDYTILNVPVGTYTLMISAVGYTNTELSNVSVSADLASYNDVRLPPTVTELGETIKVVAKRPMIVRDQTGSINIITQQELRALPTRGVEDVVGIQAGVVKIGTTSGQLRGQRGARESSNNAELNIRGGRPSEVAFYVDGFSQQDPLTGNSTTTLSNNSIKEIMVISGGFPVEYGHVTSGIVNVITNDGSDEYFGNTEAVFDEKYGQKWLSLDLAGPVPGLEDGSFFLAVERRDHDDRSPSAVTSDVVVGAPDQLPANWLEGWSYQGKFNYKFTPNMTFTLSANGNRDEWSEYRHSYMFNSEHAPYYLDKNLGVNAKLTHALNSETFYDLSASYFVTERFRGDGVHREDLFAYGRPNGNNAFDNEDLFGMWDDIDSVTATVYDTMTVDSVLRTFIVNGDEGRIWDDYMKRKSSSIGFKGMLTSAVNDEHTVKVGFEFQRHTLRFYRHYFPKDVYKFIDSGSFQDVNRYGYDMFGEESDDEGWENETKHPINFAGFVQDRWEIEDLIITAGLRFDYFNYNAQRLRNANLPLNPDSLGFPDKPPADITIGTLEEADLEDSENFTRISPRLGIAYPISDKTQMRFNYGKFFQRPELIRLYVGYDFMEHKVGSGGYYVSFGNPNLEPPKTTAYEIGISHMLSEATVFDVNLFYRDVTDLVQVFSQSSRPTSFATYHNSDYGTIKGVEFQLKMNRTNNILMDLKYTISYANGTGSYSNTAGNIAWVNSSEPKQTAPLDYDQRQTINGVVDLRWSQGEGPKIGNTYIFADGGINVLFSASSGLPFTPIELINEATVGAFAPNATDVRNSKNGPWTFVIDFKMEKTFNVSNYSLTPYLWVKNVLDRDNVVAVWEGSGRANTTGWLETPSGQEFAASNADVDDSSGLTGEEKYRIKENNPQNYANPRQILAGIRISF